MLELEPREERNGGTQRQNSLREPKDPGKRKYVEVGLTARKQALVDNIDAWAMWISPPIFVLFNIIYWVAYRVFEYGADSDKASDHWRPGQS